MQFVNLDTMPVDQRRQDLVQRILSRDVARNVSKAIMNIEC